MTLRQSLLATVEAARALTGPMFAGVRINQLTIRKRTWSGTYVGDGTSSDSDLVLPAHYRIRFIDGEEVLQSGGQYNVEDIIVDGITPSNGAGVGYTPAQLSPPCPTTNIEVIYLIIGDHPGEYTGVSLRSFRAFRHTLILRRRTTTP